MIISRRRQPLPQPIPGVHQAQSKPTAPSDLASAIVGGSIALEWDAPAQHPASIPSTPQADGTLTSDIPNIAGANGLNHANFTCRWIPNDGTADAGIRDATGTARKHSDENAGTPPNARVLLPDRQDRQEPLPAAWLRIPWAHQAPQGPQVEAGYPALSGTSPPHVTGGGCGNNLHQTSPAENAAPIAGYGVLRAVGEGQVATVPSVKADLSVKMPQAGTYPETGVACATDDHSLSATTSGGRQLRVYPTSWIAAALSQPPVLTHIPACFRRPGATTASVAAGRIMCNSERTGTDADILDGRFRPDQRWQTTCQQHQASTEKNPKGTTGQTG